MYDAKPEAAGKAPAVDELEKAIAYLDEALAKIRAAKQAAAIAVNGADWADLDEPRSEERKRWESFEKLFPGAFDEIKALQDGIGEMIGIRNRVANGTYGFHVPVAELDLATVLASNPLYTGNGKATFDGIDACLSSADLDEVGGWYIRIGSDGHWSANAVTPGGGDEWLEGCALNPKTTLADIRIQANATSEYFDIDEYVQMNLGGKGAPDALALAEDAIALREMYADLAAELNSKLPALETAIEKAEASLATRPPAQATAAPERAQNRTI